MLKTECTSESRERLVGYSIASWSPTSIPEVRIRPAGNSRTLEVFVPNALMRQGLTLCDSLRTRFERSRATTSMFIDIQHVCTPEDGEMSKP